MKIFLGSDHRGYELKEKIAKWLQDEGHSIEDVGASSYEKNDDYPVFSKKIGDNVSLENGSMGILLCGSGAGAVAAVNKVKGIRASLGLNPDQVRAGRNDDDINVLVIAADFTLEDEAKRLVDSFLNTPFDATQERYQRRIDQISKLEND